MAEKFQRAAATAVWLGRYIPSHDETHDLAEGIGKQLDEFRAYIAEARTPEQADEAVKELIQALAAAT